MDRRISVYPFVFLILLGFVYVGLLWWRSTGTELQLAQPVKIVGVNTPVEVVAVNPHGIRELRVILVQGNNRLVAAEQSRPAERWSLFRAAVNPTPVAVEIGTAKVQGLKDGKARLVVESVSNDLRGRRDELALDIEVNTQPPSLVVDRAFHTMSLGGSHAVTFTAGGYWTEAGVRVGPYTFRSHPLPGANNPNRRICFFGYPWDTKPGEGPVAYARNPAGAEASEPVGHTLKRVQFRTRQMMLDDKFLQKIFQSLDPGGSGDVTARFVKINSDMRRANNATLADLRNRTASEILWRDAFVQQGNTAVEAQFCDIRKYFYKGQSIDEQVHLGFDLASLSHAPIGAANAGKVVWAAPLGIYGNAVVVDHGLGVQSLYAHLSSIAVKEQQTVKKGEILGKSGDTGLAGGDHLHFGIQVDGVAVNPLEWLDPLWIRNIMAVLEAVNAKAATASN